MGIKWASIHVEQFVIAQQFPDPTTYCSTPAMVATQQTPALFKPIKVGRMALQHRVVLAPLTRFRAYASHVPGPQQASYYAQRGSTPGSLLIAEATFISHDAGGYAHVPGIYTEEQIQAWKKVRGSFFRSKFVLRCVIVGHRRGACQGIIYRPPAVGTGSCC